MSKTQYSVMNKLQDRCAHLTQRSYATHLSHYNNGVFCNFHEKIMQCNRFLHCAELRPTRHNLLKNLLLTSCYSYEICSLLSYQLVIMAFFSYQFIRRIVRLIAIRRNQFYSLPDCDIQHDKLEFVIPWKVNSLQCRKQIHTEEMLVNILI
jgi:hypothetical protein